MDTQIPSHWPPWLMPGELRVSNASNSPRIAGAYDAWGIGDIPRRSGGGGTTESASTPQQPTGRSPTRRRSRRSRRSRRTRRSRRSPASRRSRRQPKGRRQASSPLTDVRAGTCGSQKLAPSGTWPRAAIGGRPPTAAPGIANARAPFVAARRPMPMQRSPCDLHCP
jgi:hypothetical protein